MNKHDIIEKLREIGIESDNAYPKSSFMHGGDIYVSFFERELRTDFYFFNTFDKKLYRVRKMSDLSGLPTNEYKGNKNYLVKLSDCEVIWEDKPFVELPDLPFSSMTLRHYAAIHLREPLSGLDWLDEMIKKSKTKEVI